MMVAHAIAWFVYWPLLTVSMRISFHFTDVFCSQHNGHTIVPHDCLSATVWPSQAVRNPRQIIRYCLDQCPMHWFSQLSNDQSRLSFLQLAEQNISSRQLYLWSAPIDLVERYQFYLDQPSSSMKASPEKNFFYNCSWPRFGPWCEYLFDFDQDEQTFSSLSEFIYSFYSRHEYTMKTLTCYEHLQCNRGPSPSCLDWTEICDGHTDCLDGGQDEENCWRLEFNECAENEYRCENGQCIPKEFRDDPQPYWDCLHSSDAVFENGHDMDLCKDHAPSIACEDIVCSRSGAIWRPILTSSCISERNDLLLDALFSMKPSNMSDECWVAFNCVVNAILFSDNDCHTYSEEELQIFFEDFCPDGLIFFPSVPLLFGHLYFAYEKECFRNITWEMPYPPHYICYNDQFCGELPGNFTCHRLEDLSLDLPSETFILPEWDYISAAYNRFRPCRNQQETCSGTSLYKCQNSTKCITRHRLLDRVKDCFYGDDEELAIVRTFVNVELSKEFFHCSTSNDYISARLFHNGKCDCPKDKNGNCDDELFEFTIWEQHVSFTVMCDGFLDLYPVMINGDVFTDESECEHWPCINIYTHCTHFWNCIDGRDEIDCDPLAANRCSSSERLCVQPETNELQCLSVKKINDGHIDCLGATDEVKICRTQTDFADRDQFHCINDTVTPCISSVGLCNRKVDCVGGDDEQFCSGITAAPFSPSLCEISQNSTQSNEVERFFCQRFAAGYKPPVVHFTVSNRWDKTEITDVSPSSITRRTEVSSTRCHRGLPVKLWLDGRQLCFCPPSFYGDQCQFQNERVSLMVQFRALSDSWQTLFAVVVLLIDESDQRQIQSSEQFTYLSMRDCQMKFGFNLLYATRPKNPLFNYSIQIDLYEKETAQYRASWLIPLRFPFLPVQRVALLLDIPHSKTDQDRLCSDLKCQHGRCVRSVNENQPFCLCYPGWSGRLCQISSTSQCSSDAVFLGQDFLNRSICLCPKDKFGPRCFIKNDVCDEKNGTSVCMNGGKCYPNDEDTLNEIDWTCICPDGYTGDRCERQQTQLIVTFDQQIELPSSMLVYFIQAHQDRAHEIATTFKAIPLYDDPLRVYWSAPFDLVFIELFPQDYYLAVDERTSSKSIEKKVTLADRCPSIREIFNQTVVELHLLRRIKLYHLPCQEQSLPLLSCFFDEVHFCVCYTFAGQRMANCLEFDHGMDHNCLGRSSCENDAQCFQDNLQCPQTSRCICPACFYGTLCQFTMNAFSLSLDPILGDHIRPRVSLRRQSSLIIITLSITVAMTLIGWINGILALITFKNKTVREVGCGYYLYGTSLSTLFTMTMFLVKYILLLATQMGSVTNRSFLSFQCLSIDFLIRCGLNMDQWLNACVAIDRAWTVIDGVRFDKSKSQQRAKRIIPILVFIVLLTTVYDPLYRRLIEDESIDETRRIWCIVSSPNWLRQFDSMINMTHFLIPFTINLISVGIIIWNNARTRANVRTSLYLRTLLGQQLRQHKHLLITPFLIIILGLPRIIIAAIYGCMKSDRNPWPFLLGYFVSFIGPMLVFVLFVLPSKTYKDQFYASLRQYRTIFSGCLTSFRRA